MERLVGPVKALLDLYVEGKVDEVLAGEHDNAAAVHYACGVIVGWHSRHGADHRDLLRRRWRKFAELKPLWK
jgi:hypothetical protein